ncbi:hypothetical protein GCM10025880_19520 [Methylorubrum aminovorans]|nr:hypothetical protein GCM10025880_19520 [Methylorubrum aminovorans]
MPTDPGAEHVALSGERDEIGRKAGGDPAEPGIEPEEAGWGERGHGQGLFEEAPPWVRM